MSPGYPFGRTTDSTSIPVIRTSATQAYISGSGRVHLDPELGTDDLSQARDYRYQCFRQVSIPMWGSARGAALALAEGSVVNRWERVVTLGEGGQHVRFFWR